VRNVGAVAGGGQGVALLEQARLTEQALLLLVLELAAVLEELVVQVDAVVGVVVARVVLEQAALELVELSGGVGVARVAAAAGRLRAEGVRVDGGAEVAGRGLGAHYVHVGDGRGRLGTLEDRREEWAGSWEGRRWWGLTFRPDLLGGELVEVEALLGEGLGRRGLRLGWLWTGAGRVLGLRADAVAGAGVGVEVGGAGEGRLVGALGGVGGGAEGGGVAVRAGQAEEGLFALA